MKKLILFLTSLFAIHSTLHAQCPSAQFSALGTVCAGVPISISNTSTGAVDYFWDFCAGDFDSLVTDTNDASGFLNTPSGITPVVDASGRYVFVCSRGDDKIVRYDYGNGWDSPPTLVTDLGNILGQIASPNGIAFYRESSVWYALVLSVFNNTMTKLDFGNGLDAMPTAAAVIVNSNLNFPRGIDIGVDGSGNIIAVISNFIGSSLTSVNFGNSINNVPTVGTPFALAGAGAIDVAVVKECGNWYALASCYSSNEIYLVDFGNSLANTPVNSQSLFTGLANPSGVSVARDNDNWYVLASNSTNGKVVVQNIGNSFSTPTPVLSGEVELGGGNPAGINLMREASDWYAFVSMEATNAYKKINFRNVCAVNTITLTDPTPANIIFSSGGTYHVSLEATDASGNTDYFSQAVPVFIAPVTNFAVTGNCIGDQSIFIDSTFLSAGSIISWHWDFGNSDTSNIPNPIYTYPDTGQYLITLTTVANNGCSDAISIPF
nr:PKD domain-containing protein [Bacteroidia bacterium]